ncbi:MAG: rRNA maturation RNase YbeY [bacterium]
MLKVSILNKINKKFKANWIKQIVKTALKYEGISNGEVSIVLGDDELLQRLNKEYRRIDKPTDVLAFGYGKINGSINFLDRLLLGEIIISLDAVLRQAKEYKHSFEKELTILLIHGILHILGYDHSPQNLPEEPMVVRMEEILKLVTANG